MGGVDPGWGVMEIAPPFLFCAFRSRVFAFRDLFRSFWVRLSRRLWLESLGFESCLVKSRQSVAYVDAVL